MVARYGDYVLLKPPFKLGTWLLWLGAPLVLLVAAARSCSTAAAPPRRPRRLPPLSDEERERLRLAARPLRRRMLEFLLALLTTATVGALLVPLLRAARSPRPTGFDGELAIYRDQLAEIERERAAGTLPREPKPPPRALEIERRILAAADAIKRRRRAPTPRRLAPLPAARACARHPAAGARPLSADRPARPARRALRRRRQRRRAEQPMDVAAAWSPSARARAARRSPNDADALSALGEALTLEADGTVTPPPSTPSTRRSPRSPTMPRALYYLGLHEAQSGRQPRRAQALAGAGGEEPARRALPAHAARRDARASPRPPACRAATRPRPIRRSPSREQQEAMAA